MRRRRCLILSRLIRLLPSLLNRFMDPNENVSSLLLLAMKSGDTSRLKSILISVAVTQSWRTGLVSNSWNDGRFSRVLKPI
jgi:hypothetical protein